MTDAEWTIIKQVLITKINQRQAFIEIDSSDNLEIIGIRKFQNDGLIIYVLNNEKYKHDVAFSPEEQIGDMIYRKLKSSGDFISLSIRSTDMFGRLRKNEIEELLIRKFSPGIVYLDADTINEIGFFKIGVQNFRSRGFKNCEFLLFDNSELPKLIELEDLQLSEWLMKALLQDKYSKALKDTMIQYFGEDWINEKLLIYEVGD